MENNEQKLPNRVSLPTELINEILGVFGTMPYNQSAGMIAKIQQNVRAVPDELENKENVPELEIVPDDEPNSVPPPEDPEKPM